MREEKIEEKTECVSHNDSVNRDAEISPPTPETEIGGSGSTDCSFSAIDALPVIRCGFGDEIWELRRVEPNGTLIQRCEVMRPKGWLNGHRDIPIFQGVLGDAYEAGFSLDGHPEGIRLRVAGKDIG